MDLGLDTGQLSACVQCGLCLSSCPTYHVTGDEAMSPRGRIHLMRDVQHHSLSVTPDVVHAFDSCIQCLGCETSCPSGVQYGSLIEQTRSALADQRMITPRWFRMALTMVWHPRLLHVGSALAAFAGRFGFPVQRLGIPRQVPFRRGRRRSSGGDVYLFTGCVMDSWQRHVHDATQFALEAAGFGVTPTGASIPCCGALHAHAGLVEGPQRAIKSFLDQLGDDAPIVVNSAGCGAAMKSYGTHSGDPAVSQLSSRVFDICEFLSQHLDRFPVVEKLPLRVALQDPCHLRHAQRVHLATRDVLRHFVAEVVELDDAGMCCGAGGAYSVLYPGTAGELRLQKLAAIERALPDVVASGNPGCGLHLGGGSRRVLHPMELVAAALRGERVSVSPVS